MAFGKTIRIFLIDGDPNGRMSCELSNWSGKAYKIPRVKIKDCTDRDDLNSTGVYLLFGRNEEGRDQVYIGEAETIYKRLKQQISALEFWNEVIVFISKDGNLNKAHIKYIENRLHQIAKHANRYLIENTVIPTQSSISESDKAEMEEFIEYVKLMVNTLGHRVFDDKRDHNPSKKQDVFLLKAARGADAKGIPSSEGFVVFKGSKATVDTVASMTKSLLNFRDRIIKDGAIVQNGDHYEFPEDYIFSSPSAAASVILGRNANGLTEWKQKDGLSLKQFELNEKS